MNNLGLRVILDNLRAAGNVGSILRTSDACGVELVYACGTTPYPRLPNDDRPEHVVASNTRAVAKTALGADSTVPVTHYPDTVSAVAEARDSGFIIIVLEQSEKALKLADFTIPQSPVALVFGAEVDGVSKGVLDGADLVLELPMMGRKNSLNVSVAAGIALYLLRYEMIGGHVKS